MSQWHGGKGSSARPFSVDRKKFEDNWDRIFKNKKEESKDVSEEQEVDPEITDEASPI